MSSFRKGLLFVLPAVGLTLLTVSHMAGDGSLLATFGPKASFLILFGTFVVAVLPKRKAAVADTAEIKPVTRHLPSDVLNDATLTMTLPARIEAAIELSKQQSRMLGVVAFRLADYTGLEARLGAARAEEAFAAVAARLRRSLRKTDSATVNGRGEVLVCLPLIGVRRDLDTIAARLAKGAAAAMAETVPDADEAVRETDIGIAMYPIGGYSGEELIETAQAAAVAARAKRLGRPVAVRPKYGEPTPVMPPRKAARPRRRPAQSGNALAR